MFIDENNSNGTLQLQLNLQPCNFQITISLDATLYATWKVQKFQQEQSNGLSTYCWLKGSGTTVFI